MHPARLFSPCLLGLGLCLAGLLVPSPAPVPQRDPARDMAQLQQTECEYRGITTTFGELTRVYVLQTYEGGELLRWQAEAGPGDSGAEMLVTAVFRVSQPKPSRDVAVPARAQELRQTAAPTLGVAWHLTTLAATRVTPANEYAADALDVYRQTVDGFIGRMAVTTGSTLLRQDPQATSPTVQPLEAGTVVLLEPDASPADSAPTWRRVRIPSTATRGWVEAYLLQSVANAR